MTALQESTRYGTAASRWAGIGPYYGMFPAKFSDWVVAEYSKPGDMVLDPFAGRGTSIFSAAAAGRSAIGIDINPLGFVYANAKLKPGDQKFVTSRLERIADMAGRFQPQAERLPTFFQRCFTRTVNDFLLAARATLDWRRDDVDRTLMAFIMISLHGKRGQSLSNQMRQSTAMSPDYCIRWWNEKDLAPPDIDPVEFLKKRIIWRYKLGVPETGNGAVLLADSNGKLPELAKEVEEGQRPPAKLLITSPPYHNVTNYYYDQWLRIWMLGGPERPSATASSHYGGKFSNLGQYRNLLDQVFAKCRLMLTEDAVLCVRTDRRQATYENTRAALEGSFPDKRITETLLPVTPDRQTKAYSRGGAPKQANCEIKLILEPR